MNDISKRGKTYDKYDVVSAKCICVYKKIGFTPLQVLTEIRTYLSTDESSRCTYVGRLDPMAEGWMYMLWSGDSAEKERLQGQDKVYEVEVLFGVSTDTGDVLGLSTFVNEEVVEAVDYDNVAVVAESFVGPFTYSYPTYSSPHMKKLLQAESISLKNQNGFVHAIKVLGQRIVTSDQLEKIIEEKLGACQMDGDFRLEEIQQSWKNIFKKNKSEYMIVQLEVNCGSGTYMRTLAEEFGKKYKQPALALSIVRTKMISK